MRPQLLDSPRLCLSLPQRLPRPRVGRELPMRAWSSSAASLGAAHVSRRPRSELDSRSCHRLHPHFSRLQPVALQLSPQLLLRRAPDPGRRRLRLLAFVFKAASAASAVTVLATTLSMLKMTRLRTLGRSTVLASAPLPPPRLSFRLLLRLLLLLHSTSPDPSPRGANSRRTSRWCLRWWSPCGCDRVRASQQQVEASELIEPEGSCRSARNNADGREALQQQQERPTRQRKKKKARNSLLPLTPRTMLLLPRINLTCILQRSQVSCTTPTTPAVTLLVLPALITATETKTRTSCWSALWALRPAAS